MRASSVSSTFDAAIRTIDGFRYADDAMKREVDGVVAAHGGIAVEFRGEQVPASRQRGKHRVVLFGGQALGWRPFRQALGPFGRSASRMA